MIKIGSVLLLALTLSSLSFACKGGDLVSVAPCAFKKVGVGVGRFVKHESKDVFHGVKYQVKGFGKAGRHEARDLKIKK